MIDQDIIKNSDCSNSINSRFVDLIQSADGKVSNSFVKKYLGNNENQIEISPKVIEVKKISHILNEKLNLDSLFIINVSSLHGKSSLNLSANENFSVKCNACDSMGLKNLKVTFKNKSIWFSAKLGQNVSVLKPIQHLNRQTPVLSKKDFVTSKIQVYQRTNHFTDLDNIQFYRLNRNLNAHDFLKNTDVTPKSLVNFGQKVHLKIKTKTIELKSVGIAKKGGKLGDFIEVQNIKTKKIFLGKIVDFNKVVVEI